MRRALAAVLLAGALLAGPGCSTDQEPVAGETTIEVDGTPVHAIERGPGEGAPPGRTVLFLHGQSYTSRIWSDRGILDAVAEDGWWATAIDLPGYGDTPERPGDPADQAAFLAAVIDELGGPDQVVLVSPSRSGDWSLPYLTIHADDGLAGFVPVAPVGIDGFVRPDDARAVPTLSVWGSEDESYSAERAARLVDELGGEPAARTEVIEGASHAAYDDHPDEFTDLLLAFLADRAGPSG